METIRAFAAKPSHVQSGDGACQSRVGASNLRIWDVDEARRSSPTPEAFAAELRSRAAEAIVTAKAPESIPNLTADDFREQATLARDADPRRRFGGGCPPLDRLRQPRVSGAVAARPPWRWPRRVPPEA
jgi:hypothetical protein